MQVYRIGLGLAIMAVLVGVVGYMGWLNKAVSPVSLVKMKAIEAPFLQSSQASTMLVYFGFVGCHSVCPMALSTMAKVYQQVNQTDLALSFVDLREEADAQAVDRFTRSIHPSIAGWHYDKVQLTYLTTQFGISAQVDASDTSQLVHTDAIFLLHKDQDSWYLYQVYIGSGHLDQMVQDVRALLR